MPRIRRRADPVLIAFIDRLLIDDPSTSAGAIRRAWSARPDAFPAGESTFRRAVRDRREARPGGPVWAEVQAVVRAQAVLESWTRHEAHPYRPEPVAAILARLRPPGLKRHPDRRAGRSGPGPKVLAGAIATHGSTHGSGRETHGLTGKGGNATITEGLEIQGLRAS